MRANAQSIPVLVSLLCTIYRDDGFYMRWTEDQPFLVADELGISEGAVTEIAQKAIQVDFFDSDIFDKYRILTSRGIQKRYFSSTSRKKEVLVPREILLIDVSACNNVVFVDINSVSACNNPQSKVKERVNYRIGSLESAFRALHPRHLVNYRTGSLENQMVVEIHGIIVNYRIGSLGSYTRGCASGNGGLSHSQRRSCVMKKKWILGILLVACALNVAACADGKVSETTSSGSQRQVEPKQDIVMHEVHDEAEKLPKPSETVQRVNSNQVIIMSEIDDKEEAKAKGIPEYVIVNRTSSEDFLLYNNGRFRFHTYIPSEMTSVLLPTNGDGAEFRNREKGISLRASGFFAALSLGELYQSAVDRYGENCISYKAVGDNWYVLSGIKDGQVFYLKQLIGQRTQCSMEFTYPVVRRDEYDWMIPVLESHFYQEDQGV